ncbi:hypothetical protein F901_00828 [Acinetobacter dispersus]|uniref:hypothetical protein n=1 Tax=Acinetobacter dispersus TaxID=70348 RepID=UPI0002D12948|nr:hypothetical protein [Acinetobacter dispersus]ENX53562.1 hypothetical protein F901_00828 [Acinetobacter dispersus]
MSKYPTVKKTAKDPLFILNKAQQNIKSKQKSIYMFVEGDNDKKFLKNLGFTNKEIGFDGFNGKDLVKQLLILSRKIQYSTLSKCIFIMDIDYDFKVGNTIYTENNVFYHGYCNINKLHYYNDLEVFLYETKAFQKILNEFDLDEDASTLRGMLSALAAEIGYLKLADEIIMKANGLSHSIIDGLDIESFIQISDFTFQKDLLKENLKIRSPKKEYVEDVFIKAIELKSEDPNAKISIKGHDLTKLLEIYLKSKAKNWAKQANLEMTLRVGFDPTEYFNSPLGQSLATRGDIKNFL